MNSFNCIYMIKNIKNNKVYIGQTTQYNKRITHHKSDLKHNRHSNTILQNDFNLYGDICFEYSILEICNESELDKLEIKWIKYFDSIENGYNQCIGGRGISGYKHTSYELDKMTEIQNPNIVLQFDENFQLIKEWRGGSSEIRKKNKYTKESIDSRCLGYPKNLIYKNSYWVFKSDYYSDSFSWESYLSHNFKTQVEFKLTTENYINKRPVGQYNDNGMLIKKYTCITEASWYMQCATSNIAKVLNSNKKCKGFYWKYINLKS